MPSSMTLYGDEELISIATGSLQPLAKAPSTATVITAREIKAMGATDIDQVLETVPGLHVSRSTINNNPIYTFRGIYTSFNPQVLMMINGIPINNLLAGDRSQVWGGMPVAAIARIEVIRGPGSAIYGADAFAGVINIHTKSRQDIEGLEAGIRLGSFGRRDSWITAGGEWSGWEIGFFLEKHQTDGHAEEIDSDAQSLIDARDGTSASLAPGPTSNSRDNYDLRLDISRDNWRLRSGLQRRRDQGSGAGLAQALDPSNRWASDRKSMDLSWTNPYFTDTLALSAQLSYLNTSVEIDDDQWARLYPSGTTLFGPPLPDGMIGNPETFERYTRLELSATYSGLEQHLLRLGVGGFVSDLYKAKQSKNWGIHPVTGNFVVPTTANSEIFDVSDTPLVFITEGERHNSHLYLQDIWSFANDWELTAGVRYDSYSDFGTTVNPRAALVWSSRYNLTTKLLYGRAFRAPSWAELHTQNNAVVTGNPDLAPETIESLELAFDYRPTDTLQLDISLYHYDWDDIIEYGSDTVAQNQGRQTGYGLELAADWRLSPELQLKGSYARQRSTDVGMDEDPGNAPKQQLSMGIDWTVNSLLRFNSQINHVGERKRVEGDNRDPMEAYTTVDFTLRHTLTEALAWALSVHNLFDAEIREPTPKGSPISNDLPLPGRNIWGEVSFRF